MKKVLLAGAFALLAPTLALAEGDPDKGKKKFVKCKACHQVGPGAKNALGPHLNGIVGRAAGSVEGYEYSADLKNSGLTWDEANLMKWISKVKVDGKNKPGSKVMVPGTKMIFPGLKEKHAKNVLAYLKTLTAE
jgi:cytochrome c